MVGEEKIMASDIEVMIKERSQKILENLDRREVRLDEELSRRFRLQKKDARIILKALY